MNCPYCRQPVISNARFCGHCGKSIEALQSPGMASPLEPAVAGGTVSAVAMPASNNTSQTAASASAGLLERLKNILLSPKNEWLVIEPEPTSIAQAYIGYVMPLAALAAVMSFIHTSVIGISVPFAGTIRAPFVSGLTSAVLSFVMALIGLYLVSLIINGLAPTFSGIRDQRQAFKTASYAFTPAWIGAVLYLLPTGTLLQFLAGLYGIYLMYLGLPVMMKSNRDRAVGYTAAVVICTILMGILLGVVMAFTGGMHRFGSGLDSIAQREASREEGATIAGNILGNALGTDDKGKAGLGAALSQLAKAGEQTGNNAQSNSPAANSSTGSSASPSQAPASGDNVNNAMAAAGGLLSALGGAAGGSHRVNPVDFHTLQKLLPESLSGLQRTNAEGRANQAIGVKGTSATGSYRGSGDERVQVKISDISGVAGLMDLATSIGGDTESESDSGYEKNVSLSGRSVHEKYDRSGKHGELQVIVAKRFEVDLTGDSVDMNTLEKYLGDVNLSQLEAMRDANPQ